MRDLNELYSSEYMEKVFYFCLKKTGSDDEAKELAADVSLCVLHELHKGIVPMYFSAWVWKIANNRYSVWADKKHKKSEYVSGTDISDFEVANEDSIETELVRNEDLSLLRRELAFISSDYRNIVVAFYIDDLKAKDIAKRLNFPESTVRSKLFRARNILKEGMDMARQFGVRSYNPEDISFAASGSQPSGLPWGAVGKRIPKNILLQANNNPSTIEELSMELGIAVPYMEEEIEQLLNATLLKKVGSKYVTNFFIADKECQLKIYMEQRQFSKERSEFIDKIADDMIPVVRSLGIVRNNMTDAELKWWIIIHIIDYCVGQTSKYNINWPEKRESGETWGFIGFEKTELPEICVMGNNNGNGTHEASFGAYKIGDYDMWDRRGEMKYDQIILLADLIRNNRNISTLTIPEKTIWDEISGIFAHAHDDGTVIPDILVFENDDMDNVDVAIKKHMAFDHVKKNIEDAFDKTVAILKESSIDILCNQLPYCAFMLILNIRMMTVHDEVESGKLIVPHDPKDNNIAMYMKIK